MGSPWLGDRHCLSGGRVSAGDGACRWSSAADAAAMMHGSQAAQAHYCSSQAGGSEQFSRRAAAQQPSCTAPPCYAHGCRSMIDSPRCVFLTDVFVKSAGQGEGLHGSLNGICHARHCCVAIAAHVAVIAAVNHLAQPLLRMANPQHHCAVTRTSPHLTHNHRSRERVL